MSPTSQRSLYTVEQAALMTMDRLDDEAELLQG